MGTKKNFVLDTNVILHDYNCLKNFQENDITSLLLYSKNWISSKKETSRLISMLVSSYANWMY